MRKIFFIGVFIFIYLLVFFGCASKSPLIEFDSTEIDLGEVLLGDSLIIELNFRNSGNDNLLIKKINAGCFCTEINLTDSIYLPGESGKIEVLFIATKDLGKFKEPIVIQTNTQPQLNLLNLTGEIIER